MEENSMTGIGDWLGIGGFLFTLGALAVKSGELKRTIAELEKRDADQVTEIKTLATKVELAEVNMRQKEDRDKNDERFEELYKSRNEHESVLAAVSAGMKNLMDAFSSMKEDVRLSMRELKADIQSTYPCGS
jgi:uncharacterized protein (DUF3084 family)